MKRLLEIGLFLGFSAALHAAVFVQLPEGSVSGSGAEGADRASVQAASGEISAMVARWTAPPEVAPVEALPSPEAVEGPLVTVQPDAPAMPTAPDGLTAQTAPEALPKVPAAVERPAPPATDMAALSSPAVPDTAPALPSPEPPVSRARPEASAAPPTDSVPERGSTLAAAQSIRPETRPERAAQRQSASTIPQAERRAAGTGGGAAQGNAGSAPAATQSTAERHSLMAGWGAQITARIERRKPRVAGAGVVTLQLVVARGGQVQSIAIARSSGSAAIDEAGIRAVRNAGRLPEAPDGLNEASYRFNLPIRFL